MYQTPWLPPNRRGRGDRRRHAPGLTQPLPRTQVQWEERARGQTETHLGWWPDNRSHFPCLSLARRSELLSWEGGSEPCCWDGRSRQDELLESVPGHPQGVHGAMTDQQHWELPWGGMGRHHLRGTHAPAVGFFSGAQRNTFVAASQQWWLTRLLSRPSGHLPPPWSRRWKAAVRLLGKIWLSS